MRQQLKLHPNSRSAAVTRIEVDLARPRPAALVLRYLISGVIGDLYLPALTAAARADELWRRTCLEAFVRPLPGEPYFEFNFAPSTQWAAYRFSGYRAGMSAPGEITAPAIETLASDKSLELRVSLELDGIPGLPADAPWRLSLSAVIEEVGGGKSYWALSHPPGQADFHHASGFSCELPALESP